MFPLFLFHSVRAGKRQAGDHQKGHTVAGEVEALPGRASGQQDTPRLGLEVLRGVGRVAAQDKERPVQLLPCQPLLYGGHGGVGGEQHQGVTPGGLQQDGHLLRQQVVVPSVLLPGRKLRQVEQTVFLVVEGRGGDRFYHPPVRQQARFLLESAEICPHGQSAGGEDHGPVLAPQGVAELGGQVGDGRAEHGAAPLVLRRIEYHIGPAAVEHRRGGEHPR